MPRQRAAHGQTAYERFRATYPEMIEKIVSLRPYRVRQLDRLSDASLAQQRDLVRRMLRDGRLHTFYAYEALRRSNGLTRATPETISSLATSFNAFAPIHEHAELRLVEKGSGRRWVHDFGPRRRMHQALVADILRQLHPPLRTQMLFNGGMPAALQAVATAYREGMTHGVEVDIVGFYGSISHERLAGLLRPLPPSVVDHVVWDFALRGAPSVGVVGVDASAPTLSSSTGLSLGAGTSPIVGERIISALLAAAQLPETITYADNLFVMGRSEAEVATRLDTIRESAALLDVGALRLSEGDTAGYSLSRPFGFLKREGDTSSGEIIWRPAQSKLNQFRVSAIERSLEIEEIAAVERRVRHWRRSYGQWPEGDVQEAEYLAGLAARRFYADSNASNRTAAVHAITIAFIAAGQLREVAEFVPTEGDPGGQRRNELLNELHRWLQQALLRRGTDTA